MTDSVRPPLHEVTARLREHLDPLERRQGALLYIQATRREHASERRELRQATDELRRWRQQQIRRGPCTRSK